MKQKDKEVLLKTFCSLLLYNGYFSHCNKIHRLKTIELDGKDTINNKYPVEICYPYLRPMSSMTEDERKEFSQFFYKWHDAELFDYIEEGVDFSIWKHKGISVSIFDWLNTYHFDYRGLIEKGLALEAPEGMYNIKN